MLELSQRTTVLSNWKAEGYLQVTNAHEVTRAIWDAVPQNSFWNKGTERDSGRHRIHPYPAKFPAFIASKAFGIARERTSKLRRVADVFCGCGTVAYEARREGLDFWGCDINPVATLIARTKRGRFKTKLLELYRDAILKAFDEGCAEVSVDAVADARLEYWYEEAHKAALARLLLAIRTAVPSKSRYRDFFLCGYSAILKATSRWLTKSIKPQIDPNKKPTEVRAAFVTQTSSMIKAFGESAQHGLCPSEIVTGSVLKGDLPNKVEEVYDDLIRLQSVFLVRALESEDQKPKRDPNGFEVYIFRGKRYEPHSERYLTQLATLLKDNTVLRLEDGHYDEEKQRFTFDLNGRPIILHQPTPSVGNERSILQQCLAQLLKAGRFGWRRCTTLLLL